MAETDYRNYLRNVIDGKIEFKIDTEKDLLDTFNSIYPDIAKLCNEYEILDWDDSKKSAAINFGRNQNHTQLLFEISRNPFDNKWTCMRCFLFPTFIKRRIER